MTSIDELLTRAVSDVVPRAVAESKLKTEQKLRIYFGIDPTGAKLHLGHSVPLRKMRAFQDAGHHVILVIGSFTAMIGDPTGRDEMRKALTSNEVKKNFETYIEQAKLILDMKKIEIRYNHEWLEKLGLSEIVKLASNFTVQKMLERDMFHFRRNIKIECPQCHCKIVYRHNPLAGITTKDNEHLNDWRFYVSQILTNEKNYYDRDKLNLRGQTCDECKKEIHYKDLKESDFSPPDPIHLHEFFYPLMVGYDSVVLDVDCEIGGNDQLFNMLAGRTLQHAYKKRDKFVLTTKLIDGTDGRKMSKTYNNCVYLTDSAEEMYGRILSMPDNLIPLYMECCTDLPMTDVKAAEKALKDGKENPKNLKMRLAREIVTIYHSAKDATAAEEAFENVFKKKGVPEDMPEYKMKKGESLIDALLRSGSVTSKSEARRLIEQGGVKVNNATVKSVDAKAEEGIVKVGKRKFVRITL